jgi:hypothetical protein
MHPNSARRRASRDAQVFRKTLGEVTLGYAKTRTKRKGIRAPLHLAVAAPDKDPLYGTFYTATFAIEGHRTASNTH